MSEADMIREALQPSAEVQERIEVAAEVAVAPKEPPKEPPKEQVTYTADQLEEQVRKILSSTGVPIPVKPQPEPDWGKLSELEATDLTRPLNIPVITHEVPAYLEIKLADNEYVAVWANRDQRRLGELEAQGYEFLRREHISKDFKLPLKFDSEGLYIYADVIAMRVHKRILFGKRRRTQEMSMNQLKGVRQVAKNKVQSTVIEKDPELEQAFEKGSFGFYDVNV
jgi:hypothetical protein